MRIAGMSNIDNFALLSPVDLSLVSLIVPEKISVVYSTARKMIDWVHEENKSDIESMRRIRQEVQNMYR